MEKKFLVLIVVAIALVIVVSFFVMQPKLSLRMVSSNPDLLFDKIDWNASYVYKLDTGPNFLPELASHSNTGQYSFVVLDEVPPEILTPWVSNHGFYYEGLLPNAPDRKGIVILHPVNQTVSAALSQRMTLPSKPYVVAKIADIADFMGPCEISCSDVVIAIKILDNSQNVQETVYQNVSNSQDGWKSVYLDISQYANKDVTFSIEGISGGPCGNMCAEWAGVDYFGIGQLG